MSLTNHKDFLEALATSHNVIQHTKEVNGKERISYFRSEADFDRNKNRAYPCIVAIDPRGRFKFGSDVEDVITAFFEIRNIVPDITDEKAIETAKDECKTIGDQIAIRIAQMMDDQGAAGAFAGFDLNTVQWDFTGPMYSNVFGCLFFFEYNKELTIDFYSTDLGEIFS